MRVQVIADHTANPAFVASDLLSQAEHGVDSQVVLVAVDLKEEHLAQIEDEVEKQALALERVDIIRQSIPKSNIVKVKTVEESIQFSNDYAPEHLILHLEQAKEQLPKIDNAGSVFVGPYTPERSVFFPTFTYITCLQSSSAVETTLLARTTLFRQTDMLVNSAASTPIHSRSTSLRKR